MDSGNKVRVLRKQKRMTQEQLAEVTELSVSYISQIESGRKEMGRRAIEKIAKILEVSPAVFIYESGEENIERHRVFAVLSDCTYKELNIICDVVMSLKNSLRTNKPL
ncbi:helix-turn-helix domain-containing protein [Lacrimispora xylanisolvens]|uniref:helix-turn-helix domain-containing protein n=1 Tax=Lacrimispora xylanisolvens TaxID=384636 RepID=UPI002402A70E